jgi:hypothetical protein
MYVPRNWALECQDIRHASVFSPLVVATWRVEVARAVSLIVWALIGILEKDANDEEDIVG